MSDDATSINVTDYMQNCRICGKTFVITDHGN